MQINPKLCAACGQCQDVCPEEIPESLGTDYGAYWIDPEACTDCGACAEECPQGAISC